MEERVTNLPHVLKGHHGDKIEIAGINIAYKNREIIKLLQERGAIITGAKFDKLEEIDKKIDECVTANFEKLTTPIYAFVMFNTQEGYERAVEYLSPTTPFGFKNPKRQKFEFLGRNARVQISSEPSNIIWENLEIGRHIERRRRVLVTILIGIFIFATFMLFTYLKQFSGRNAQQYPKTVNCKAIKNYFVETTSQTDGSASKINMSNYYTFDKAATMASHGSGYYQCFCQEFGSPVGSVEDYKDLCKMYTEDQVEGQLLGKSVTILISVFNIILRTLNTKLIEYVGLDTVSMRTAMIMMSVFIT
jgi:hypothetical protein